MSDDDAFGDEVLETLRSALGRLGRLEAALRSMQRYLRDEGYGDPDDEGPEGLDDD